MYDEHGAPLMPHQELRSLVSHFSNLFGDATFDLQSSALTVLPFTQAALEEGFSRLPITKALAPVWKYFAPDLATVVYPVIHHAWVSQHGVPPTRWSTG